MPSARTHQRRLAILAVLHEEGPCWQNELCTALRRRSGTLYSALVFLEKQAGLIVGEAERTEGGKPGRTVYRLTTKAERAEHDRRRATAGQPGDDDTMGVRGAW